MAKTLHKITIPEELSTNPSFGLHNPLTWFGGYVLSYSFDMGFNGGNPSNLQINMVQDVDHIMQGRVSVGSILGFPIGTDYTWHGIIQSKEYQYDGTEQKDNIVITMESIRSALQNICCIVGPDAQRADVPSDTTLNIYQVANTIYGDSSSEWDIWKIGIGMPFYVFVQSLKTIQFSLYGINIIIDFDLDDLLEILYQDQEYGLFVGKNIASLSSIFDEIFSSIGRIWIDETEVITGDDLEPTSIKLKIKTINRTSSTILTEDNFKSIMNFNTNTFEETKYNNIEKISFGEELRRDPIQHRVVGGNIETFYAYDIKGSLANGNMQYFFGFLPPSFGEGIRCNIISDDNRTLTEKYIASKPFIRKFEGDGVISFNHAIIGESLLHAFIDALFLARRSAEYFYILLSLFLIPYRDHDPITGNPTSDWKYSYSEVNNHPLTNDDNSIAFGGDLEQLWEYINEYGVLTDWFKKSIVFKRKSGNVNVNFVNALKALWTYDTMDQLEVALDLNSQAIFLTLLETWQANINKMKYRLEKIKGTAAYNQQIDFNDLSVEGLEHKVDPIKWELTYNRLLHVFSELESIKNNLFGKYLVRIPDNLRIDSGNNTSYLTTNNIAVSEAWWGSMTNGQYYLPVKKNTNANVLGYRGGVNTFIQQNVDQTIFMDALTENGKLASLVIDYIKDYRDYDLTNITGTIYNVGKNDVYASCKVSVDSHMFMTQDMNVLNRSNSNPYSKVCKSWESWALISINGNVRSRTPLNGLAFSMKDIGDLIEPVKDGEMHYGFLNQRFNTLYLGIKSLDIRYGPWSNVSKSDNPIEIIIDDKFVPWDFGDDIILDTAVSRYVESIKKNLNTIKRGQISCYDYYRAIIKPGYPIANGTDSVLTHINSTFGNNGWRCLLTFESYSKLPGTWRQSDYDQARKNQLNIESIKFNLSEKLQGIKRLSRMVNPPEVIQDEKLKKIQEAANTIISKIKVPKS
jgi:hypothetical protein